MFNKQVKVDPNKKKPIEPEVMPKVKDKALSSEDDGEELGVNLLDAKYLKKYAFSVIAIGIGLIVGGVVTAGIIAGLLAAVGTMLSLDRLKECWPEGYNWIIDHPGWVEIITTVGFAGAFGLTATGIVGGMVANIFSSAVIDFYTFSPIHGRIEGVQDLSFGMFARQGISKITNSFKSVRKEVKEIAKEIKENGGVVVPGNTGTSSPVEVVA